MILNGPKPTLKNILLIMVRVDCDITTDTIAEKYQRCLMLFLLPTDSDGGGGEHNSGTEQMSVSETESEVSAKFEEQVELPDQEDPPETEYTLKEEGDVACSVCAE